MAFQNISSNDCFNISRVFINNNNSNFDRRLISLTNDYNFYTNENNNINNRVFGSKCIIQKVTRLFFNPGLLLAGRDPGRVNLSGAPGGHISIQKVFPDSKVLIELTGGRWRTLTRRGIYTYFFGRAGNVGAFQNILTGPAEYISFDTGGGTIYSQGQHYAKALYSANQSFLEVEIWAQRANTPIQDNLQEEWNMSTLDNIEPVPYVLTLTEISN